MMYDEKNGIRLQQSRKTHSGSEVFETLTQYITSLPADKRAPEAIRISSQLLEFTAFETAGQVDSACVGALIECAAKLSEPDALGVDPAVCDTTGSKSTLQ